MKLYNIKENDEQVSFGQAVRQGLGRNQGLFFPSELPKFDDIDALLEQDFLSRSTKILSALIGNELTEDQVNGLVDAAFQFPAPIKQVKDAYIPCFIIFILSIRTHSSLLLASFPIHPTYNPIVSILSLASYS